MFVDASALVAMMTGEEDATVLAARLERARRRVTSPIAVFEATTGVARILALSVEESAAAVTEFLRLVRIDVVPIPADAAAVAINAFARYGKGQRHPAQLNMGDCFAYAGARTLGEPLLYKGGDFANTDIEPA